MVVIMLVVPCAKWRDEPYRESPADITEVGEGRESPVSLGGPGVTWKLPFEGWG